MSHRYRVHRANGKPGIFDNLEKSWKLKNIPKVKNHGKLIEIKEYAKDHGKIMDINFMINLFQ